MSSRNWQLRIQHILTAAYNIREYTQGLTFENFSENNLVVKAVLYDYMIIGEASRHIPQHIQERYSEIPWRLMGDMRNVVTHEYFIVLFLLLLMTF